VGSRGEGSGRADEETSNDKLHVFVGKSKRAISENCEIEMRVIRRFFVASRLEPATERGVTKGQRLHLTSSQKDAEARLTIESKPTQSCVSLNVVLVVRSQIYLLF
jgi:hypothetical protein